MAFLEPRLESSLFLVSNVERAGLVDRGEPFQATYASIFKLPFGAWIGFNNTVVTGSILMGLYVAYPVYWFTQLLFKTARLTPAETTS